MHNFYIIIVPKILEVYKSFLVDSFLNSTPTMFWKNIKSTSNELWKGWKLAWYHQFTHIACAKKLRGLRRKLDALRVQNGQSLSKYQGFGQKRICYKGISFFWTYLNSRLFVCSKCTFQSHIITFQPFSHFICYFSFISWFILSSNDP